MSEKWTAADIPDQAGRTAVVTGANSGLGLAAARALARGRGRGRAGLPQHREGRGGAGLDPRRAPATPRLRWRSSTSPASTPSAPSPSASPPSHGEPRPADQQRRRDGAAAARDRRRLRAAVRHQPPRPLRPHRAAARRACRGARTPAWSRVSSTAHKFGRIDFDNLQGERRYCRWRAYGQSKLANLLFARELDRRLRAAGSSVKSLAAHPGYAATNLQSAAPPLLDRTVMTVTNLLLGQSPEMGALPELYAATRPNLDGGLFIGPDGFEEQRGYPKVVSPVRAGRDEEAAARLWDGLRRADRRQLRLRLAVPPVHRLVRPLP